MGKTDGTIPLLVLISIVAFCFYRGTFYQTGAQWYEACWYAQHSEKGPKTPEEAAAWSQCTLTANRAFYNAGLIITYENPVTPTMKAVDKACPSGRYVPVNIRSAATDTIVAKGGPDTWDKFLPATWSLNQTFEKMWPTCSAVRTANGIPKMVEQGDSGWFDWASKCEPCEANKLAAIPPATPGPYTLLPEPAASSAAPAQTVAQ